MGDEAPQKPARQSDRDARLKAALKQNMARRKAQKRARATVQKPDPERKADE